MSLPNIMVTGAKNNVICCVNCKLRCTDDITLSTITNKVSTIFGVFLLTKVLIEPPKCLYMRSQVVFAWGFSLSWKLL